MDIKEKQKILTGIIVIAFVLLALVIGYVVYDEINSNKQETNTIEIENQTSNDNTISNEEKEENIVEEEVVVQESNDDYIGEEEIESSEDTEKTTDEKALELAKKTWGEDDTSVTFSIEEKIGNIYHIAVKSNAYVATWYEVNTETWEISEYY